jgi:hypothetical protein
MKRFKIERSPTLGLEDNRSGCLIGNLTTNTQIKRHDIYIYIYIYICCHFTDTTTCTLTRDTQKSVCYFLNPVNGNFLKALIVY